MDNRKLNPISPTARIVGGLPEPLALYFFRYADRLVSPDLFLPGIPGPEARSRKTGRLSLEIVSHCWNYSQLLAYGLSSFVLFPPRQIDVTVTVYYSREDRETEKTLEFFSRQQVENIRWNWVSMPTEELMRRAIGRNRSALSTQADWVWFTDCDLMFREGCLDALSAALQGRNDALLFPAREQITPLLSDGDPLLRAGCGPEIVDIDPEVFSPRNIPRAVGAFQIVHGDVARACGYCDQIPVFQRPTRRWRKTYEDRTFRWLIRDQGKPLDIPSIYRIRHQSKGRYKQGSPLSWLRARMRKLDSAIRRMEG